MGQTINEMFQSMYDEYKRYLRIIAIHYKIPRDEQDDIIQETFLSFLETYAVDERNKGWLLTKILKNKCIDYYRKKHYEKISSDSEEGQFILDAFITEFGIDTSDTIGRKELNKKVRECISQMRSDWREVIYYCCILGYNSEEAGKIIGISGTACRSRLMRAREYIKRELGDEFHEYYG